jgi:hypothetical protein
MFVLDLKETHLMKQSYVDLQTSLDTPSYCNEGIHKNKQTNNGVVSYFKNDGSLWIVAIPWKMFELKVLFSHKRSEAYAKLQKHIAILIHLLWRRPQKQTNKQWCGQFF